MDSSLSTTTENSTENGALTLYNYFRSSTSYRVRCALEYKKLPFIYKAVHLLNNGGEQNQPAYRSINPIGGVPTLVLQNQVISQSYSIIEFLDHNFPQSAQLFPQDPFLRAKVSQFCQTINADMHAYGNLKTLQFLENEFKADQSTKEKFIQKFFGEGFFALEKMTETFSGQYSFGDQITAADCFLVPVLFTAQRFQVRLENFPHLVQIANRLNQRDDFKAAHPFRQPDTPPDLKIT